VIILEDFNAPNYDLFNGAPLPYCYYYNGVNGNLTHTTFSFLGLNQYDYLPTSALLRLVFPNTGILNVSISNCPTVNPNTHRRRLCLRVSTSDCRIISLAHDRNYAQGVYILLYKTLLEQLCLLGHNALGSAESQQTFRRNISPPFLGDLIFQNFGDFQRTTRCYIPDERKIQVHIEL
jgi:hypothetical protein